MIHLRRLVLGLCALCFASAALGQPYRPGFGFSRPGFQFLNTVIVAATTWSTTDKAATDALSGGNLVATRTSSTPTYGSLRATAARTFGSGGKYQFEVTPSSTSTGDFGAGIATSAASLANYVGQETTSIGYYKTDGGIYRNALVSVAGATFVDGTVLGFVLDQAAGTIAVYKNGALQGTITGLTGSWFPAASLVLSGSVGAINCGQTSFSFPIAGASPWG